MLVGSWRTGGEGMSRGDNPGRENMNSKETTEA